MRSTRASLVLVTLLGCALLAQAQAPEPVYLRMYSVNYNPFIERTNQRLHQYGNWNDPTWLNGEFVNDFAEASHGVVKIRQTVELNFDDYPQFTDGFRYDDDTFTACVDAWSGWYLAAGVDYRMLSRNFDFARRVDFGEVDEVNNNCAPYFSYYETNMSGYGGYWCNSGPTQRVPCSRIFIITGFNYERGVAEMIHSIGHGVESVMSQTYGGWSTSGDRTLWDRFSWNIAQSPNTSTYGIGSCHYPCNGDSDYDYGNVQSVVSYAPAWLNDFPNFNGKNGQTAVVDRETWGGPDYQRNFLKWWYAHMPHTGGRNQHDGYDRLNNWWQYIFNFNAYPESGGDHYPGQDAPVAATFGGTVYPLATNTQDDWRPLVNASGRVVWYGGAGTSGALAVFSANLDGSDLKQLTLTGRVSELPQINDNGKIVFQQFDTRDYEIWTVNADGTGIRRLTNNAGRQDWHADINNGNRVVWEGHDGTDYEIYSANADGTDLVNISNNAPSTGRVPDDLWPRINDAGRVVWMGWDGGNWDIFSANSDGTGKVNVSNSSWENEFPQIGAGGHVVWHAWHSNSNAEVYIANATGSGLIRVTNNSVMDWWPQVNASGDMVWMQRTAAGDWEIMYRSAAGIVTQITNNDTHDEYPVIDDSGRIAWHGWDGHDWEIYLYENGTIYQVTNNDYDDRAVQFGPNGKLVWHAQSQVGNPNDPNYAGPTTEIWAADNADLVAPTLSAVSAVGQPTRVVVLFSEPVDPTTAGNTANYAVDLGITVQGAALQADQRTVWLTTSPLTMGLTYTLTVNNVRDLADNPIAPDTAATFVPSPPQRVTDGLVVLYDFAEGSGSTVHDVSGLGTPFDLTIQNPARATWSDAGLQLTQSTAVWSTANAAKIISACQASNELTLEAWVTASSTAQGGPARIVTLSPHTNSRDFSLSQGTSTGAASDSYFVQLRTTTQTDNGLPGLSSPTATIDGALQQVVFTRDSDGSSQLYVDAEVVAATTLGGDFSNWALTYGLVFGNEYALDRPWLGTYRLVAIYGKALTASEVLQNYDATAPQGPALCAGDANCDGAVDFKDIDAFVSRLGCPTSNPTACSAGCNWQNADINGDGSVTFADIDPFVGTLGTTCP